MKERVTDHRKHQQMPDVEMFLNHLFIKPVHRYEKRRHGLVSGDSQHIDVKEKTKMITILLNRLDDSEVTIGWLIDILHEEKDGRIFAEGNAEKFKMDLNDAVNVLKVREEKLLDCWENWCIKCKKCLLEEKKNTPEVR